MIESPGADTLVCGRSRHALANAALRLARREARRLEELA